MTSCYLWEERLQDATIASTIRSILNAAMTCHGANGGKTFRNTAWDHMTGCPTRFDASPPIERLAHALNAGADGTTPLVRLNPATSLHIIFRASLNRTIIERNYGTQESHTVRQGRHHARACG